MPARTRVPATLIAAAIGFACVITTMLGATSSAPAASHPADDLPAAETRHAQDLRTTTQSLFTLSPSGPDVAAKANRPGDTYRKEKPRCTKHARCRPPTRPPGGSPDSWAYLSTDADGIPVHWDSCKPIRFKINPAGATQRMLTDVNEAIKRVSIASGIEFQDAGATDVIPFRTPDWYSGLYSPEKDTELYIAFSNGTDVPGLAGAPIGIGSVVWSNDGPGGAQPLAVLGGAVFDTDAKMINDGFGLGMTRGSVMLHELGHVMNLAHVSDPTQVMFPTLGFTSVADYQAGDRNGFEQLAALPCG